MQDDKYEHYNYEADNLVNGQHSGKHRSKRETEQHTNRHGKLNGLNLFQILLKFVQLSNEIDYKSMLYDLMTNRSFLSISLQMPMVIQENLYKNSTTLKLRRKL